MRAKAAFSTRGRDQGHHRKPKTEKRLCGQAPYHREQHRVEITEKLGEISAKLPKNLWLR